MDLNKMFEMQRELDERIVKEKGLEGQDLLLDKILALQVELGECANEWRGFKFWSVDREPRIKAYSHHEEKQCGDNGFSSIAKYDKNPLLEEYVDCLHFILSIGLDLEFHLLVKEARPVNNRSIAKQFVFISTKVGTMLAYESLPNYLHIIENFIGLGEMLGFTWEQIEQAYYNKNKVNHVRQDTGY
ncbi:dUTP diphosphatase [Sporosarcina sp. P33]|uniref:dUTP diphosphatase n=1 Tax=Sporosarcina sp. P33 TaxID=1930764 RepID=UPI0009C15F77|nr:dUTP diphosphatase [Sporosarcina sp. P33]ARD47594.1 hypothetical protein SporoP33_04640 [Sporosarcina sp. P33]